MADVTADEAVDAVLAEMGAAAVAEDDGGDISPAGGEIVAARYPGDDLDPTDDDNTPVCTADEARQLVEAARRSITALHDAMTAIIKGRAWIALGYQTPEQFWVKEFSGDETNGGLGYSRSYLYRTAQVLAVLYGLHQRLGDAAFDLEINERAIRAIPKGDSGEWLDEVLDDIATEVQKLPEDASTDQVQEVADRVINEARRATDRTQSEQELAAGLAMFGITTMEPDPDTFDPAADEPGPGKDSPAGEGWREDYERREGLSLPGASDLSVDADSLRFTLLVADLQRAIEMLTRVCDAPTEDVLARMSPAEVERLAAGGPKMISVLEQMVAFSDSDEAPIDTSDLW